MSRPLVRACAADLRRNHPQEKPFSLSLRQYDTVANKVSGKHVQWTVSGTLTRSGDADLSFFDCNINQQDDVLTVTYSHASLWFTLPPS
ncbi:hypothetical protein [Deinococcus sp.]|uniref:hypothetical protein n=1 Tax=Deinococcus sp. TaxID=47478 RepID=UPI002869CA91|nr:hypothetical protein [Deinococcus sp.]